MRGHAVTEVVEIGGEHRCGACEREARIDSEAVEEGQDAEPGSGQDESGAGVGVREEQRQDVALDSLPQPAYGMRGTEPGPRGCWALNVRGEPCGSFKTRATDFCSAHSGLGIGKDPARYSPIAHEARREQLAHRAQLRLVMGDRGRLGPRAVLREQANVHAARLAGRAIHAALSPEVEDAKAGALALRVIEAAEPRDQSTLTLTAEQAVEEMSLGELIAFAQANGLDVGSLGETPPTPPQALPAST